MGLRRHAFHRLARALGLALLAAVLLVRALPAAHAVDEFATPAAPPPPSETVPKTKPLRPYIPHVAQKQCPKVIGQSLDEAKKYAAGQGVVLYPVTARPSDRTAGTVVDQDAAATRLTDRFYRCAVVVAEAWTVTVPKLIGTNVRDAPGVLGAPDNHGLLGLGRQIKRQPSGEPPGTILEQTPPAGKKVSERTLVYVAVAVPRPSVTVPKVVGELRRVAEAMIAGSVYKGWLTLVVVGTRESTLPPDTILAQNPAAGQIIYEPTRLQVVVARQAAAVVVPDLVGFKPKPAGDSLAAGGFRGLLSLDVVGERQATDRPPGTIVAQDPPAGTRVTRPTAIRAWVAAAPPPPPSVRVPNLSTLTPSVAGRMLHADANRGLLDLGVQHRRPSKERPGTIVDQKPPAGTPVATPTRVEIWVAEAPPAVVVPNLVDSRPPDAKVQLASETFGGLLSLGEVREREADKPEGVIVAQAPVAGSKVSVPTRIDLWVAAGRLVVVPDLSTLTRDGALAALTKVGLTLRDARSERRDGRAGSVVGQKPEAGARVRIGSPVSIVLVAPPAFWKLWHLVAAVLAVLTALAARTAWQRWRLRLSRVAYRAQGGGGAVTLEAPAAAGGAVRLRAARGTHETYPVEEDDTRPRRRPWPRTT